MDVDDFDPSSLLELAMEENEGTIGTNVEASGSSGVRVEPCPDATNQQNNDIVETPDENAIENPSPSFGVQENQNDNPETSSQDLGSNEMCSVPLSMFQLFDLDQYYGESEESSKGTCKEVLKQPKNDPKKPDNILKIRSATYSEKTFRKNLFMNAPDTIRLFKLHCTVCAKHIGTSISVFEKLFRVHRDLKVTTCRQCYDFYGPGNFPIEENSEIFCEWCGQGGTIFCCNTCTKVFCESCIILNFGQDRRNEIESALTWSCFICNPRELWPHRAICWAFQKYIKETRIKVFGQNGDKQEKLKQMCIDISNCCLKSGEPSPINLPPLSLLQKIPMCLIADKHSTAVTTIIRNSRQTVSSANQTVYIRRRNTNVQVNPAITMCNQVPPNVVFQKKPEVVIDNLTTQSTSAPVEIIDLIENNDNSCAEPTNLDLNWLFNAVRESTRCINDFQTLVNQFDQVSGKLKTDRDQVNQFTGKLHSLFKITISNLAKIDYKMLADLKDCLEPKVRNLSSNISIFKKPNNINKISTKSTNDISPQLASAPAPISAPASASASESTEEEDLTCLLFCETVMTETIDGNKENEINVNNNLISKGTKNATRSPVVIVRNSRKRKLSKTDTPDSHIPTIVLDDDEPIKCKKKTINADKYGFFYKKFNIKPCKVMLSRCDTVGIY